MKIPYPLLAGAVGLMLLGPAGGQTPATPPASGHRPNWGEFIKEFDKNGDGQLSPAEQDAMFKALAQRNPRLFAKFDKNGDGRLDDAEKAAAWKAIQQFRAAHPNGVSGWPGQGSGQGHPTKPASSATPAAPSNPDSGDKLDPDH